ncbi:hypothetical protein [Nostoc sp. UHCC 0251]|nr:hypothetical protein [Nostoc sp. UHCC 0251]MEA5626572.1 hypothetical protein [Nostoc sp. UHCC 0251]
MIERSHYNLNDRFVWFEFGWCCTFSANAPYNDIFDEGKLIYERSHC